MTTIIIGECAQGHTWKSPAIFTEDGPRYVNEADRLCPVCGGKDERSETHV